MFTLSEASDSHPEFLNCNIAIYKKSKTAYMIFLIDIVHCSYFSEFLKQLNSDFKNMRKAILENHDEFVKSAEEAKKEYEELKQKGFLLV